MRKFFVLWCIVSFCLSCFLFTGCDSDDETELSTEFLFSIEDAEVETEGLMFGSAGGKRSLSFTTNVNWTIAISSFGNTADWCTASLLQGKAGENIVQILVEANPTEEDRTVVLTFKASELTKKITVTQTRKSAILVAKNEYVFSYISTKLDIDVNTNVDFVVNTSVDWIVQLPDTRSLMKKTLHFAIGENSEENEREGIITVSNGDLKQEIRIVQNPMEQSEVSPAYVAIDWDKTELLKCNPDEGKYSFCFAEGEDIPDIHVGSTIVIDADTIGYVAIVKQISQNGNIVNVETKQGTLCDIFANTEFTLSTAGGTNTRLSSNVFYPIAVVYQDERGKKISLNNIQTRGESHLTGNLWNWGHDFSGAELFSGNNYKIYLQKAKFGVSIDLDMTLNFGGRNKGEIIEDGIYRYMSKAVAVTASIIGMASTEQVVRMDAGGKAKYDKEDDLWKHNIFKPISVKFVVYGVPVWITLSADLYRGCYVHTEGEMHAWMGYTEKAQGKLGIGWEQSTNKLSPLIDFSNDFELISPTLEGKGEINAKAWLFPRIRANLYGLIGPSFDLKPYLRTQLNGGFKEELLSSNNDFCAWSLKNYVGLDIDAGLSLTFMNYETENYSLSDFLTEGLNVIDKKIYESPASISFISSSSEKVESGVPVYATFRVCDYTYLPRQAEVVTPLAQIVKFEGNGSFESKYGIARNGEVTAYWTPHSASDTLFAVLYDYEGEVIKKAKFYGDDPKAITGEATNITQNSATVICTYENVPMNAEYGIVLTFDGQQRLEKFIFNGESGKRMFPLTELKVGTTYSYYAYISYEGKLYEGTVMSFTTDKEKDEDDKAIDLGLSVKWASHNVGASSPEGCGGYYAWGETWQKNIYTWTTYIYDEICIGSSICNTQYDVAHVKWGGKWRMPTYDEQRELINKCTWAWIITNGVSGYKVTGPNGNSIFLPTAGSRFDGSLIEGKGQEGYYWSGTLDETTCSYALSFYHYGYSIGSYDRLGGGSVRPVCE